MANDTSNPALWLPNATEYERLAREGMIAEFDMLTFDPGDDTLLLDQSGQGNDAVFTLTPTVTSEGVQFDGTYYADFTLPVLERSYSYIIIIKSNAGGLYAFGSYNFTDKRGSCIRVGSGSKYTVEHGSSGNIAEGPATSSTLYKSLLVNMSEDNQARLRPLTLGVLGWTNSLRGEAYAAEDRTLWRIGAIMQTVAGDHTVVYQPLNTGTIAYCAVFNRVVSERQAAALLRYLQELMGARGVTISV